MKRFFPFLVIVGLGACSSEGGEMDSATGEGGASLAGAGGDGASGGSSAAGGNEAVGGSSTGGSHATGGQGATGGSSGTGDSGHGGSAAEAGDAGSGGEPSPIDASTDSGTGADAALDTGNPPNECALGCDDGDPCNGMETCNSSTGQCVSETFPPCPKAPPECNQTGGSGGPTKGKVVKTEARSFRLYDENHWSVAGSLVSEITSHASVKAVSLATVLNNLNRQGERITGISGMVCFNTGFTWESGDNNVTYWYPQGISGTGDAYDSGEYQGKRIGIVSWYHKPENDSNKNLNKGSRVAIYDVTNMNDIKYRLALLVKPVKSGSTATFEPVKVHAGGIVWYRNYLYVADTSQGFRVFDLTRIMQVKTGNKEWIGKVSESEGYHAFGYLYAIPEVTRYKRCSSSCCARFSFMGLDRSTKPHTLIAGEYTPDEVTARIHRWPLNESTGKMLETSGRVQSTEAIFPGIENMQGAISWNGTYFVSCSGDYLGLHIGAVGQSMVKRAWPYGPEDLHYAPLSDSLWSQTEHPGKRYVFSAKRSKMLTGCK